MMIMASFRERKEVLVIGSFYLESSNQIFFLLLEKIFLFSSLSSFLLYTKSLSLSLSHTHTHFFSHIDTHTHTHTYTHTHTLSLSVWSKGKKIWRGIGLSVRMGLKRIEQQTREINPSYLPSEKWFWCGTKIKVDILRTPTKDWTLYVKIG